jgi:hypothetical protein
LQSAYLHLTSNWAFYWDIWIFWKKHFWESSTIRFWCFS